MRALCPSCGANTPMRPATFGFPLISAIPDDNEVALVQGGCIKPLVAAMRKHAQDSDLQTNALIAMCNLAVNGTWYCLTPAVAVCVEHVVCIVLFATVFFILLTWLCVLCGPCAVWFCCVCCALLCVPLWWCVVRAVCLSVLCVLYVCCVCCV